jgi:hypothetical protein
MPDSIVPDVPVGSDLQNVVELLDSASPNDPYASGLSEAQESDYQFYLTPQEGEVAYHCDEGVVVPAVAGPPGTPRPAIRFHAPCWQKYVKYSACRMNAKPKLPHRDGGNPNEVLVKRIVSQRSYPLKNTRTYLYVGEIVYVYELLVEPADADSLPTIASPLMKDPASVHSIIPAQFVKELLLNNPPSSYLDALIKNLLPSEGS